MLLAVLVWLVITIELTLNFNHASGIYDIDSTGQLIPFVIGIVSMGKTLNALLVDLIKKVYWIHTINSHVEENITLTTCAKRTSIIPTGIPSKSRLMREIC